MPKNRKPRKHRGATQNQTGANRSPCKCLTILIGSVDLHSLSRHELRGPTPNNGFFSISIPQLRSLVAQGGYDLESSQARLWLNYNKDRIHLFHSNQQAAHEALEEKKLNQEARNRERQCRLEAEKFAKEAANNAIGFLTLRYSGSVEDRRKLFAPCLTHQSNQANLFPASLSTCNFADIEHQLNTSALTNEPFIKQHLLTQNEDVSSYIASQSVPGTSHQSPSELEFSPSTPTSLFAFSQGLIHPISGPAKSIEPSETIGLHTPSPYLALALQKQVIMSSQPVPDPTGGVDGSIKDVIQNLFVLQQHISAYRSENQERLTQQVEEVARSLGDLEHTVSKPNNPLHNIRVAPDIIDYVDDGRNPDIYTRDFVELVQRGNSVMNGKQKAFRDFSKVFAKALKDNFDGMGNEVDMIMSDAGMEEKEGKFIEKEPSSRNGA